MDANSRCPLFSSLGSDLMTRCASYLDPNDMVQLGRTSKGFGLIQPGRQRSLANQVAHQELLGASEHEREALPQYEGESGIKLYRELLSLRQGPVFGTLLTLHEDQIRLSENRSAICSDGNCWGTAIGNQVMRGGRHFVRFSITKHGRQLCALIGIVRPLFGKTFATTDLHKYVPVHIRDDYLTHELARLLRNETMSSVMCGGSDVHCCAYSCAGGGWYSTSWGGTYIAGEDWPGMEEMQETGEIAMLLDYVAGTLTIYKNNRRLGIVQEGLTGEYSWMVSLGCDASIGTERGQ